MRIKIHKAVVRDDGEKQVFATVPTGWFRKEAWVFVKRLGEEWQARPHDDAPLAGSRRELGQKQMEQFLNMVPEIRFED